MARDILDAVQFNWKTATVGITDEVWKVESGTAALTDDNTIPLTEGQIFKAGMGKEIAAGKVMYYRKAGTARCVISRTSYK